MHNKNCRQFCKNVRPGKCVSKQLAKLVCLAKFDVLVHSFAGFGLNEKEICLK